MLNRVVLIGRLTNNPELRYTPSGTAVTSFGLAVDRSRANAKGERETDFINIVVWSKQAETCCNHLSKGRLVAIDGRLQVRRYETQDGQKRTASEVVAEDVRFLDWPEDRGGSPRRPAGPEASEKPAGDNEDLSDIMDVGLDDMPF